MKTSAMERWVRANRLLVPVDEWTTGAVGYLAVINARNADEVAAWACGREAMLVSDCAAWGDSPDSLRVAASLALDGLSIEEVSAVEGES